MTAASYGELPADDWSAASRMRGAVAALGVAALWVSAQPYSGIRHDAELYLGQALKLSSAGNFASDIFFAYGSQDSYSLMARPLALMFALYGVGSVEGLLPYALNALLLAGVYWVVRDELPQSKRWLALASVAVMSHYYGPMRMFAFGESFLTARSLAEPLAVLAVCCSLRGRWGLGVAAWVTCAAVHPLVAIPVGFVIWMWLTLANRRWGWPLLLLVLPVVAGLCGWRPFSDLFVRFDEAWLSAVKRANPGVFASGWSIGDAQVVAFDVAVLLVVRHWVGEKMRRLCTATVCSCLALFGLAAVGADLLHDVLLTDLQLWRVHWWAHLLAMALMPTLLLGLWRQGENGPGLAWAVLAAAVTQLWPMGWAFLLWAAIHGWLCWRNEPLSRQMRRLSILATALAMVGVSLIIAWATWDQQQHAVATVEPSLAGVVLSLPLFGVCFAVLVYGLASHSKHTHFLAIALIGGLAAYAALQWDRRSDWQRFMERTSLEYVHPFRHLIAPTQQVYWDDGLLPTWLLLRRPSYLSVNQGAGMLFNRGTAIEFAQRYDAGFAELRDQKHLCRAISTLMGRATPDTSCWPSLEVAQNLCARNRALDFMVFQSKNLPRGVVAEWTFTPSSGEASTTYYLYDCNKLRST